MNQIRHNCTNCNWTETGDRTESHCPKCGAPVNDKIEVDAPAINETRPEQVIETSREPGVYVDDDFCGGRK